MFHKRIVRWSGALALTAGAFWALYELGQIVGLISIMLDARLDLLAHSLVGLAAIGIYARVADRAGMVGLAAFVIYMVMVLANTAMKTIYTVIIPVISADYPEAGLAIGATGAWGAFTAIWMWLTVLGPVLFGAALIFARAWPRWAAGLLIVGPVVSLTVGPMLTGALGLTGNLGALISALGWAWIGLATWTGREPEEAAVPTPVAVA